MATLVRTDIHRPSAIRPEDYDFVDCKYIGCKDLDPFESIANAEAMEHIRKDMERTGGRYSNHAHGGTCHVCGAHALYLAVYYHRDTNRYIQMGEDCAQKLDMGDVEAFNPLRRAIANAKTAKAGKMKAKAILDEVGLSRAWELYDADEDTLIEAGAAERSRERIWNGAAPTDEYQDVVRYVREYQTLCSIVGKLKKYGDISEKQERFLATLVDRIDRRKEIEAQRERERQAAADCPEGRIDITGTVLKTEYRLSKYGETLKMTVKAEAGFLVWGSVPGSLEIFDDSDGCQRGLKHGDRVAFTATITRSDRDPKFGFFKRPSKARLI